MVDSRGLSTRATVVKGISVRLLDPFVNSQNLNVMTDDISNPFIQVEINEKMYTSCGSEFGNRAGPIAIEVRVLYDLTTSAEHFCTKIVDYLRTLECFPCCFDHDVWMRLHDDQDGYDFICTHVDDINVIVKDQGMWADRITGMFLVK